MMLDYGMGRNPSIIEEALEYHFKEGLATRPVVSERGQFIYNRILKQNCSIHKSNDMTLKNM